MANMTTNQINHTQLSQEDIDLIVEQQANDDSAWEESIEVNPKFTSLLIPQELASKAAFLASIHREKNLETWLIKIMKERIELEEVVLNKIKQELAKTIN
jgi:hypothetical protein